MTDLRKAAEMALEALEVATTPLAKDRQEVIAAQQALRQALAEPEHPLDKKADNARELGLNYEPEQEFSTKDCPQPELCHGKKCEYCRDMEKAEQEPIPAWLENDLAFKEIMKWADIYAAQTGEIYAQAALDSSKTATMAKERKTLAFVVASHTSPISEPVKERISEPLANQEPVAYWNGQDLIRMAEEVSSVPNWTDYYHIPLYSEPQPCPTCESLARAVMMDQTSHDTAPPSKPLIALTDDEITRTYEVSGHCQTLRSKDAFAVFSFARAIEAALGRKNQ